MSILQAFLRTLLFLVFIELMAGWSLIEFAIGRDNWFILNERLITGLLECCAIVWFIYKVQGLQGLIQPNPRLQDYLVAAILGFAFILVQTPLNWVYNGIMGTSYNIHYQLSFKVLYDLNVLRTIIFIPIAEELFFRQYLLNGLQQRYPAMLSIFVSALSFAVIHLHVEAFFFELLKPSYHQTFIVFFGGIIAGWLYHRTKAVGPAIIFHMTWNFTVLVFN